MAGSFHVENIDDLHTDRYNYKKPKSTDAVFFCFNENLQFVEKTYKNICSEYTSFYMSEKGSNSLKHSQKLKKTKSS